jgi:hypothetical protein
MAIFASLAPDGPLGGLRGLALSALRRQPLKEPGLLGNG